MLGSLAKAMLVALLIQTPVPTQPDDVVADREYVGEVTISAYSYYEGNSDTTASGTTATPYKTIATSDEYEFGTVLYIEGIGECVVEDRGGQLVSSGERIDLYVGTDNAMDFGLQNRDVWIVEE